jgi:uracil-DNA glycosylase
VPGIVIVGESWGREEEIASAPFVGTSGRLLTRLLHDAGINRVECFLTNVINQHPQGDDFNEFCGTAATAIPGYPAHHGARYVHRRYAPELERLRRELSLHKPCVCILLGNTAMWALLGKSGIAKWRGSVDISTHTCPGLKCLPTYHPAAVSREYTLRHTVVMDLQKAERQSGFAEVRWPERELWIEPTIGDLHEFERRYIHDGVHVAVDIETARTQITTIGFAPRAGVALVVPFFDTRRADRSFWHTHDDECNAWAFVRRICQSDKIRKVFQNGLYDIAFLYRSVGIKVKGAEHDTMLLHHSLQPESLKGLGYLGSIYTEERAWKHMRTSTTIKQDA